MEELLAYLARQLVDEASAVRSGRRVHVEIGG
jgi:predicted RNA-binding protein YlqC (UPF0109 family)